MIHKSIPSIRFKNFEDEWTQNPLKSFLTESRIVGHTGTTAKKLTVKLWGKGVVEKKDLYGGSVNTQYYVRKAGQFMYGKLDFLHAAFGIVPESLDEFESTLDSPAFDVNNIDGKFLLKTLIQEKFYIKKGMIANGSRKAKRIHTDTFLDMEINVPSINEQSRIGNYLYELDSLIEHTEQVHSKLQALKAVMLEKMFPKDGADVPEVRFAGFSGAWKRYMFKDFVQPYLDPISTPTNGYFRLGIRSHGKGTFHSYVEPGMAPETAQMHRVEENNFIVNITFAWEHAVAITTKEDKGKLVSHRFPQYKLNEDILPQFFKYSILDDQFRHHLWLASPGGAGRNRVLKTNEMLQYYFLIPQEVEEQRKIASYLSSLDRLTELKQQELTKLQSLKKALLERMFV